MLGPLLICLFISACSEENSPVDSVEPVVHTYTLKGRIVSLPDPSNPASELSIHHEAIDDFKSSQGELVPMNAMTMSFPPAPGVSLDGFAVGDAVEFVFRVQWEPTSGMSTTSIKKLPHDAPLAFELVQETKDTSSDSPANPHAGH
jgi:hypothetical protein